MRVDIKESVNSADFFQTWIFGRFSLKRGAAKLRWAGGGRVRPAKDVNGPLMGARSNGLKKTPVLSDLLFKF